MDTRTNAIETDLNAISVNGLKSAYNTGVTGAVATGSKTITIDGVDYTTTFTIS